ncbi:MAG: hypothetical protein JJT96_05470 [Opitutales bacterium]|jgi:nitrogen fixation-related uncharacterized protein|nr:hypothetical protein [Opitutales bacterium]
MEFTSYIILGLFFSSFLFIGAACVLYWAYRNGQLNNLEAGARSIFDEEEEPLGTQTDFFPDKRRKSKR